MESGSANGSGQTSETEAKAAHERMDGFYRTATFFWRIRAARDNARRNNGRDGLQRHTRQD